ncbi:enoyl-CoA hydratase-like protein [Patellaria atrata CBS 101060]|uniref:Enoyl-CoA hydratase-like protein n=1 Tax=Patellaria atrata CBS 101060 TaxID=1346257 RepID=A0A9P4SJJ5_9PEZI|nr:enoyl-CoA hydratase-like protein [Patellaria atrata CBS 101060]
MSSSAPTSPPPSSQTYLLTHPTPHTLLITLNRPSSMNALPHSAHWDLSALLTWYDASPTLRVAIITGAGTKAFCAGQDLLELRQLRDAPPPTPAEAAQRRHPRSGFAGLSRREGRKPVIAAVNGVALGGGFEICLNCDMTIASPTATFGLPEALRGIYAGAGGLPRLIRTVGLQVASEIALTGRTLNAQEAKELRLINHISRTPESLVEEAVELAKQVAKISPDAAIVTRAGLRQAWETASVERAYQITQERFGEALIGGENAKEGLRAFAEKREPRWLPSKL